MLCTRRIICILFVYCNIKNICILHESIKKTKYKLPTIELL